MHGVNSGCRTIYLSTGQCGLLAGQYGPFQEPLPLVLKTSPSRRAHCLSDCCLGKFLGISNSLPRLLIGVEIGGCGTLFERSPKHDEKSCSWAQ
jgi:hypothetical protein